MGLSHDVRAVYIYGATHEIMIFRNTSRDNDSHSKNASVREHK